MMLYDFKIVSFCGYFQVILLLSQFCYNFHPHSYYNPEGQGYTNLTKWMVYYPIPLNLIWLLMYRIRKNIGRYNIW